jgi:dTDP-4-dehydrorhamnose reductase
MDKTRIKKTFGLAIRPWQESLEECLQLLTDAPGKG